VEPFTLRLPFEAGGHHPSNIGLYYFAPEMGDYAPAWAPVPESEVEAEAGLRRGSSRYVTMFAVMAQVQEGGEPLPGEPDEPGDDTPTFPDLPEDHWAYDTVQKLVRRGVIWGLEDGSFAPSQEQIRAGYAAMMVLAMGHEPGGEAPFTGLAPGAWYSGHVRRAYSLGLMLGTGETTFSPEASINREQAATICVRAAGLENLALALSEEDINAILSKGPPLRRGRRGGGAHDRLSRPQFPPPAGAHPGGVLRRGG